MRIINLRLLGVRKVNKIEINFATVSKKVDVKRLKRDLWSELEVSTGMKENNDDVESVKDNNDDDTQDPTQDGDTNASASMEDSCKDGNSNDDDDNSKKPDVISFKDTVDKIDASQSQNGVTLPFYFICLLHLANEKGLRLDSPNLHVIIISADDGTVDAAAALVDPTVGGRKARRKKKEIKYEVESDEDDEMLSEDESQ